MRDRYNRERERTMYLLKLKRKSKSTEGSLKWKCWIQKEKKDENYNCKWRV